jgi:hypothetical protein
MMRMKSDFVFNLGHRHFCFWQIQGSHKFVLFPLFNKAKEQPGLGHSCGTFSRLELCGVGVAAGYLTRDGLSMIAGKNSGPARSRFRFMLVEAIQAVRQYGGAAAALMNLRYPALR